MIRPRGYGARQSADSARPAPAPTRGVPNPLAGLQAAAGNGAVAALLRGECCPVQRNCYKQFASYDDAKRENDYSLQYLDLQKDDPIEEHHGAMFGSDERQNVFYANVLFGLDGKIHDDEDRKKVLYRQDTDRTPHVDHRWPSSKGGTNSFTNARVMPASANIRKGDKIELERAPRYALPQYAHLDDSPFTISPIRGFSAEQKALIYAANKAYYGVGSIVSDVDGKTKLDPLDSTQVAHVDHVMAKSEGGCNYYFNAKVISAADNIKKGGRRRTFDDSESDDDRDPDFKTGRQTLAQYFAKEKYTERPEDLEDM